MSRDNKSYVTKIRSERSTSALLGKYGLILVGLFIAGWLAVEHVPAVSRQYDILTGKSGTAGAAGTQRSVGKKVGGMWKGVGQ